MAIIVKIISADGKQIISKVLPALPSHIKVPPGARVEVTDVATDRTTSLGRYINEHSGNDKKDKDKDGADGEHHAAVTVESVDDWAEAEAWLDSMQSAGEMGSTTSADWYQPASGDERPDIMGYDKDTLLVGGLVGVGVAGGAAAFAGGGGSGDTVPPLAPSGLDLAAADDHGASSTDNITNQTTGLTITGNAEPGSKVELFDGTESLGTVTTGDDGVFTFEVDLAVGVHQITAGATDRAGNNSTLSTALAIAIDETAPAAATNLNLASADDSGASSNDDITNVTQALTIGGTAEAGATVELFDGETSLGKATAGTGGTFTLDVNLAGGVHEITAVATDVAGNAAPASDALTLTVDNTAPLAPSPLDLAAEDDNGASNTDNITSKTSNLTISGTAEAGSSVQLFDGTTALGTITAGQDGSFFIDINLAVGTHNITARATDIAGNQGPASTVLELEIVAATSAPPIAMLDETGSTSTFG
ncbi:MAG: hypothetical protein KDE55_09810 [Novosphingobium sp.]|nr:hypothetical protein [Novosphingobium sp.]